MRAGSRVPTGGDEIDPLGMDDYGAFTQRFGNLVPQALGRWGLDVRVRTDRSRYRTGQPVEVTIEIRNRLPVPVNLAIEGKRPWAWAVDGHVDASEEPLHASQGRSRLELRARETLQIEEEWHGRFRRPGSPTRWVPAGPGAYEISAYVPAVGGRVEGSTTITLEA